MNHEQFMPEDGKTIIFSRVLLFCQGGKAELHVGGRLNSLFVTHLPEFKDFADKNIGKDIDVDVYSYELNGSDWHERKATKDEMKKIINGNFPHNYDYSVLSCVDHDGPDQFSVRYSSGSWCMVSKQDEHNTVQEEQRRIAANKARHAADMPECIRLLSALEEELKGEKGQIGEWMRISYELNEDYEVAPAEMVQEICDAFRKANHQYGNHIACALYNSQSIVLPCEIVHAADYLSMGGKFQDICNLADAGVFMSDYDLLGYDLKAEMVALVNGGGSQDQVYNLIGSWECRQAAEQSDSGSSTICQS